MKVHFVQSFNLKIALAAMVLIVVASNYLVLFPINEWLTWGALPYPISFLVTELTNRIYGPRAARKVVYAGFAVAAILSIWVATPRIAVASVSAFLISQLLDIFIFNKLRNGRWWQAPLAASFLASLIDTMIFWVVAFLGEPLPLFTWAVGDFGVKLLMDLVLLTPFRVVVRRAFPSVAI